jgi:hypothetical protein
VLDPCALLGSEGEGRVQQSAVSIGVVLKVTNTLAKLKQKANAAKRRLNVIGGGLTTPDRLVPLTDLTYWQAWRWKQMQTQRRRRRNSPDGRWRRSFSKKR